MSKRFAFNIERPLAPAIAGIIAGSFLLAFVLALLLPESFTAGNNRIMDHFIRLRYRLVGKPEVSPYLIHVVVNDTSHQVLQLPSWDRSVFGRVIDILQETSVKLIACDVFFQDPSFSGNDRLLLEAVGKSRKTIFPILVYPDADPLVRHAGAAAEQPDNAIQQHILHPTVLSPGQPPVGKYAIPPFAELSRRVSSLGHINYSPDRDGICRRVPLLYRHKDGYIPAFSLKIALQYFQVPEENIEVDFGRHILLRGARVREDVFKDVVIPIDREGRIIVNFIAPWEDSFLNFPVHNVLEAGEDEASRSHLFDLVDGALVVVSDISTTNRDYGPGVFENVYPLSGIHVNIVNSILTESFLQEQRLLPAILITLFFAGLLWLLAVRFRGLFFSAGCVLLYALFIGFGLWQFIGLSQVPRIATPSFGFLLALVSVNVYQIFIAEKEKSVYKVRSEAGLKLESVNKELVKQKRDLEIANRKLADMDRFKTRFVQNIAHEFRTPLTLIVDPLDSIWSHGDGGLPDVLTKKLAFVRKNAHKLLHLVNQFLDLSKFEAGKIRLEVSRSDIVKFLRPLVGRFQSIAEQKRLTLRFSSSVAPLPCYFDPDKIDKIFANLLANSLKATEPNGQIEVNIEAPEAGLESASHAKGGSIPPDEMIRITVKDTGTGIPENDIPFIFDRFHQVDHPPAKAGGGSGVGLSLVKECVDIHHGRIAVESKVGMGTQFTVFLPWAREHFSEEEIARTPNRAEPEGPAKPAPGDAFDASQKPQESQGFQGVRTAVRMPVRKIEGKQPEEPILIVDDEVDLLENYSMQLRENGIDNLILCSTGSEIASLLRKQQVSIILLDLSLPDVSGKKLLEEIRENHPDIHVLVVTGLQDVDVAVDCIKMGAFDYMVKPVELSRLLSKINQCIDRRNLEKQINVLTRKIQTPELRNRDAFAEIITNNENMLSKFRYVEAIAESSNPVLITGESGVGKELVARAIHRLSNRQGKFVCENIAGLDDTMISDTLFGHAKGAFTDAGGVRKGLVEEAQGGTLFLDEIGDMSINSQVKLLRFIEQKEYRPLGADRVRESDARVIIATNADMQEKLEEGTFRKDLFYRLTHQIDIPPLRERPDDLPALVDHFVSRAAAVSDRSPPTVPEDLLLLLRTYDFPGNIRELKNMIENAMSRSPSTSLSLSYFKEYLKTNRASNAGDTPDMGEEANRIALPDRIPRLKELEEYAVSEALRRSKGNQTVAARLLGLSPSALSRRIKKMGAKRRT
jgi:DNA-binding NtrC family response regulator/signal transduction histidine kinase